MSLFANTIQPLINWLHINPHWAWFFTFLISLSESLAILGAIIPGSVTMTAIGILAGSGVIRIDMTLIAAILGAICGDSISYAIGYFYKDKIPYIWPFSKYPNWLDYGKEFFSRHGGKSVLLGRFIGPLRALTPIIAGIMHMKQGQFLIANALSAIGWSILYVMPGVLIGAASAELSAESATRLFIITLVLLVAIWLLGLFLQFLFNAIAVYLKKNLHGFWIALKKHPLLYQFFYLITPEKEKNHYLTVILLAITLLSLLGLIVLMSLHVQASWINHFNLPIHLLLQSFRGPSLQAFFIYCTQLTSVFTMSCLFLMCFSYFISQKQLKALVYLSSTIILSFLLVFGLIHLINSPAPQGLVGSKSGSSFPALNIAIATSFYSFIYFYVTLHYNFLTHVLRTLLFLVLGLSGLGAMFLGDYWCSDVIAAYCAGLFVCLLHCLSYRKSNHLHLKRNPSPIVFFSILMALGFASGLSTYIHFKTLNLNHTPFHQEHYLTENQWWNQQQTVLPIYLRNRIGKRIGILNIQYSGDLALLKDRLKENHWKIHNESFFTKLMQRINSNSQPHAVKLPLFEILFENKRPEMMMTLEDKQTHLIIELRLWESDYYLKETNEPIWVGSIHVSSNQKAQAKVDNLHFLLPAVTPYTIKKLKLKSVNDTNSKGLVLSPYILLIK